MDIDFVQCFDADMSVNILACLDNPADLARASSVSRFWRQFVIANGLFKRLCLRMFPQLARIAHIAESDSKSVTSMDVESYGPVNSDIKEREHKVFASLLQAITKLKLSPCNCITDAVSASSTDNYPMESVVYTLNPRDRLVNRAMYWSSKGHHDTDTPETLVYKLKADLCVITEIGIRPFEAFFQSGNPIYSAKFVRFRMGHPKSQTEIKNDLVNLPVDEPIDDKIVWTYASEVFPMTQEYCLQKFKLPEPVVCIGGFMQIELLGGVQRQEMDGLFYICVAYVQILGRPLCPAFDVEILEPSGKFVLKYNLNALSPTLESTSNAEDCEAEHVINRLTAEEIWEQLGVMLMADNPVEDDNDLDEMVIF